MTKEAELYNGEWRSALTLSPPIYFPFHLLSCLQSKSNSNSRKTIRNGKLSSKAYKVTHCITQNKIFKKY